MDLPINQIVCGDSLAILPKLPEAKLIFADPPDNLGVRYAGVQDKRGDYDDFLLRVLHQGYETCSGVFWLSYYHKYQGNVLRSADTWYGGQWRQFIWRFTFGQHRQADCGNGYRPILRLMHPGTKLYPDAIRILSARQKYNDKRADARGHVPDDVWDFPRVCGTFKERKKWHPCQHPKALIERIVKFSAKPGDLVIDMFAGSGNTLEVCKDLGIDCIGIDLSPEYCRRIAEETGAKLILQPHLEVRNES